MDNLRGWLRPYRAPPVDVWFSHRRSPVLESLVTPLGHASNRHRDRIGQKTVIFEQRLGGHVGATGFLPPPGVWGTRWAPEISSSLFPARTCYHGAAE